MQIERIQKARFRRKMRVRNKAFGTAERPRLSVFRSNRHIYAQVIDDMAGLTLASASTRTKGVCEGISKAGGTEAAKQIGAAIAKRAKEVGINSVRFDRNRYKYHGRVKALADAAREAGLVF